MVGSHSNRLNGKPMIILLGYAWFVNTKQAFTVFIQYLRNLPVKPFGNSITYHIYQYKEKKLKNVEKPLIGISNGPP